MARTTNKISRRAVEALTRDEATRRKIPTAGYQSVVDEQTRTPLQVAYLRKQQPILSHVMQDTANTVG